MKLELDSLLDNKNIIYEKDLSLSNKTWIKTGGICSCWITPVSVTQLAEVCRYLYLNHVAFDLVGQTSNVFFHSTYNPQVVVSTVKVNQYVVEGDTLTCDCGCNVTKLAKEMLAGGYAGFYGLVGLPGTVGSAAVNNAGCFSCSISSMLINADVLQPDGTVKTFTKEDFGYEKRSSAFKRGDVKGVLLSLKLKLEEAENIEDEIRKSEETKRYRMTRQEGPTKNLGSVYAHKVMRRNLKNMIASFIVKIAGAMGVSSPAKLKKRTLLSLYGYRDLDKYISDKTINTFVWKDEDSETAFKRYKEFMSRVHKSLELEIEEKL